MTAVGVALVGAGVRSGAVRSSTSSTGDFAQVLQQVAAEDRGSVRTPARPVADTRTRDAAAQRNLARAAGPTARPAEKVRAAATGSADKPVDTPAKPTHRDAERGTSEGTGPTGTTATGAHDAGTTTDDGSAADAQAATATAPPDAAGTSATAVAATTTTDAAVAARAALLGQLSAPVPTPTGTTEPGAGRTAAAAPTAATTATSTVASTVVTTAVPAASTPVTVAPTGAAADAQAPVASSGGATPGQQPADAGPAATPAAGPDAQATAPSSAPAPAADAPPAQVAAPTGTPTALPAVGAPQAPAPSAASVPAHSATTTTPSAPPLAEQLGARLTALTGPGGLSHGRHILTVPVDPEHLGPVRIVAHISQDSVRVELVGSTDASREALKGALADLRRDLAASGLTVDVGADGRPDPRGSSSGPTGSFEGSGNRGARDDAPAGTSAAAATETIPSTPARTPGDRSLDLDL